jgi:hypothetical protein
MIIFGWTIMILYITGIMALISMPIVCLVWIVG